MELMGDVMVLEVITFLITFIHVDIIGAILPPWGSTYSWLLLGRQH